MGGRSPALSPPALTLAGTRVCSGQQGCACVCAPDTPLSYPQGLGASRARPPRPRLLSDEAGNLSAAPLSRPRAPVEEAAAGRGSFQAPGESEARLHLSRPLPQRFRTSLGGGGAQLPASPHAGHRGPSPGSLGERRAPRPLFPALSPLWCFFQLHGGPFFTVWLTSSLAHFTWVLEFARCPSLSILAVTSFVVPLEAGGPTLDLVGCPVN